MAKMQLMVETMIEIWKGVGVILLVIGICEFFLIPRSASKVVGYGITVFSIGAVTLITNYLWDIPLVGFGVGDGFRSVVSSSTVSVILIVVGSMLGGSSYIKSRWQSRT